jgi:Na+-transporting NADH:ubiquinone oxidoreductase subunit F
MNESMLAILIFSGVVMTLVGMILVARKLLLPQGEVGVVVNDSQRFEVPRSTRLLAALESQGLALPSACGGKGTCGQCRVTVVAPVPPVVPAEAALLSPEEIAAGIRLACQQSLREDVAVRIPETIFGVNRWTCRVRSARFVGTMIREIVAELPPGEKIDFRAGGFVQVTAPPYAIRFRDLPVDSFVRDEWDRLDLWRHEAGTDTPVSRAYSLANSPDEDRVVMLLVRLATPPPLAPPDTPAGVVSSYLFQAEPGSELVVAGPYGHFFANESDAEMIFIAGGAGMAPMRSHILDQLRRIRTKRPISFWYGARSSREILYRELFDELAEEHANFRWTVALSEPDPDWEGEVGFIHDVLQRRYLADHASPERCEYYLCGPPVMAFATRSMLATLGVPPENIYLDDFGS